MVVKVMLIVVVEVVKVVVVELVVVVVSMKQYLGFVHFIPLLSIRLILPPPCGKKSAYGPGRFNLCHGSHELVFGLWLHDIFIWL